MAEKYQQAEEWVGQDLYDLDGNKIGTVEEVRFGDVTGGLQWLIVGAAEAGAKKIFVPAAEVRRSDDRLSARHSKARVTDAPVVEAGPALTQADEGRLCRYYGLQYAAAAESAGEGCEEMTDARPAG